MVYQTTKAYPQLQAYIVIVLQIIGNVSTRLPALNYFQSKKTNGCFLKK